MGSTFNPQILVEKLAKLNNSQASIETLSHWCIFHMNKAKQVVETWDRQFHCSPHDQRLAYLYLANDILQNSRRKGSEFVGEFWKVLPDALRYVMDGGDELGRNAALRLIGIWEERKVFGSRGQILKEELVGRQPENNNRNGKHANAKSKHSAGNTVDKIVSAYQVVSGQMDEEIILTKCRNAINYVEKVVKEVGSDINAGAFRGSPLTEELQGQHSILKSCTEQLRAAESSRSSLVSLLREAIREQEFKLDQVRKELQAAESHSEQARQLVGHENTQPVVDSAPKEAHTSNTFKGGEKDQSVSVMYAPTTAAFAEKSAAAAMAAKLTASTSSAQMLSYVLSSLASEGVIGKESSSEFPVEKRPKLESDQFGSNEARPPPPSSSPPPLPPMPQFPAPQYMANAQYSFSVTQPPPSMPLYAPVGPSPYVPAPGSYQGFQGQDGNFYNQPPSMPMAPISRQ